MSIVQICLLGVVSVVGILLLKDLKSDFQPYIAVAFGAVVFLSLTEPIKKVVEVVNRVSVASGISDEIARAVLKVAGISLLAELAATLCSDAGQGSISDKILSSGKIIILASALPVITGVLEACFSLID